MSKWHIEEGSKLQLCILAVDSRSLQGFLTFEQVDLPGRTSHPVKSGCQPLAVSTNSHTPAGILQFQAHSATGSQILTFLYPGGKIMVN